MRPTGPRSAVVSRCRRGGTGWPCGAKPCRPTAPALRWWSSRTAPGRRCGSRPTRPGPSGWEADFEVRPGERAVSLRLRGGGPILLRGLRLSVQPGGDGAGLTVRGGTTNMRVQLLAVAGVLMVAGAVGVVAAQERGPGRRAGAARSRGDPGRAGPEPGPGGPAEEAPGRRSEAGHSAARRPGDRPDRAPGGDGRAERRRQARRRPGEGDVRPAGVFAEGADRPAAGDAPPAHPRAAGEDEAADAAGPHGASRSAAERRPGRPGSQGMRPPAGPGGPWSDEIDDQPESEPER